MRHILVVDSLFTKPYNTRIEEHSGLRVTIHELSNLLDVNLPQIRQVQGGVLFYKLIIYANTKIEAMTLSFVLSRLRDTKDDPSGIGN